MDAPPIPAEDTPAKQTTVKLGSAALARILEEVRNEVVSAPAAYNRMHNRHNR